MRFALLALLVAFGTGWPHISLATRAEVPGPLGERLWGFAPLHPGLELEPGRIEIGDDYLLGVWRDERGGE